MKNLQHVKTAFVAGAMETKAFWWFAFGMSVSHLLPQAPNIRNFWVSLFVTSISATVLLLVHFKEKQQSKAFFAVPLLVPGNKRVKPLVKPL